MRVVDRTAEIIRRCRSKRVLHLGCTNWPDTRECVETGRLLHAEIDRASAHVIGVDKSAEGLEMLRCLNPSWDLRQHDPCTFVPNTDIDIIVATELIEHLDNPGQLLSGVARWATPRHELIVSTPNGYSLKGALRALLGHENCHRDHAVMFTAKTLCQNLARNGWVSTDVLYHESMPSGGVRIFPAYAAQVFSTLVAPRTSDGLMVIAHRAEESAGTTQRQRAA